ncbi:MAG TPA: molybdenum cofactor biosynthesis protein MoaE [Chthonomonadales bacterium]|nr:molybdenum cofactor biosynthesis protein MoaE [Chthonomonadales bacterium]
MAHIHISPDAIDVQNVVSRVSDHASGALCTFVGQVRNSSRGRQVAFLEYQAYVPLAEKSMRAIAEEAEQRWTCQVAIWHRTGRIELGEASVAVAVSSPHRAEAFEACRFCIDTLKVNVPIWKREVCPDGSYWIEGEAALEQRRQ